MKLRARRSRLGLEFLEDRTTPAVLSTFLTTQHVDLNAVFTGTGWNIQPRVATGPVSYEPDTALLVVGTNAQEARPAGAAYDFIGVAGGANYYRLPQSQNANLLYLGIAGYGVAPGTFTAYDASAESKGRVGSAPIQWVKMTLESVSGPGAFSIWQDDIGGPIVFMSSFNDGVSNPNAEGLDTTDGISADDAVWILPGGHSHYNFGFTAIGRYEVTMRLSARQGAATVISDPITLYFSVGNVGRFVVDPNSYTVNENAGTASVTVNRVGGSDGRITVNYATANGSAIAGQDFLATSGTLTFNDQETTKTISIPIIDDTVTEPDETFTVTISNPGPASIAGYTAGLPTGSLLGTPLTATVTIVDNDVNTPPTISDVPNQTMTEDVPLTVNFIVGDTQTPAADLIVTASGGNPSHIASLVVGGAGANRTVTITPVANAFGAAGTITLSVSDGTFTTTDTFTVTITPVADTPTVTGATTNEDTQTTSGLVISRNAADGVEVTHFKITNIRNGTLFQNNGTTPITAGSFITVAQGNAGLRFTPALNLNNSTTANFGFDVQASMSASDAGLGGSVVTASVSVIPVNDPPTVNQPGNVTVAEDSGLFTQANFLSGLTPGGGPDEAGQVVTITATNSTNAALFAVAPSVSSAGTLTFTPATNAFGSATVTVTIQDNGGIANGGINSTTTQFTITVTPVADTPNVTGAATTEGIQTTSGLVITRNPVDGAEVTHVRITAITNGLLFQNDGVTPIVNGQFITFAQGNAGLRFTPTAGVGDGTFQVQASTSATIAGLGGGLATATITVARSTPFARDDAYGVSPGNVVRGNVLFNDSDPNGDPITVTASTAPIHGMLVIAANGAFTYTPGATFTDSDTFTYTVSDTNNLSATGTVTITARPADPGIATAYSEGDVDLGVGYVDGVWEPHIHDEENALELEPDGAIFHVRPAAITLRPAGEEFGFIGVPGGASFYRLPANLNPALVFLGFGAEEVALGDFVNDELTFHVLAVDGPGQMSIWDDSPGGPVVLVSTADGLTDADRRIVLAGSHSHSNWGFTARGLYAVTVQYSGTLAATNDFTTSDPVTYYFAIDPENTAPTQTLPAAVTTPFQTAFAFTGANAVSVADADPSARPSQVTVAATNGVVSVAIPAGITFVVGDGTNDATVTMQGSIAALNAALAGLVFTPADGFSGNAEITVTTNDLGFLVEENAESVSGTITVTVQAAPSVTSAIAIGGASTAILRTPSGTELLNLSPFGATYTGGVRVAAADFNGDGVDDLVVGTGPGRATLVRVLDGATGNELFSVAPFEARFTGGVYVAVGDITGDGTPDLVITPDEGGGPRVQVYDGSNFAKFADFFGIDDDNFRGGARAAIGDFNSDGKGDLVVAAGFGGGPRVAVFDGAALASTRTKLFNDFFLFEQSLRNGAFVAAGDVDGDGVADLIGGGGPGGGPRVLILDGSDLIAGKGDAARPIANFFAGNSSNRGGIRVSAKNLDGDANIDLVVGDGTGAGSQVTQYSGTALAAGNSDPQISYDAFPGSTFGVFVG